PLLSPGDIKPSREGLQIACLLNPGVFQYEGKTCLLVRVAERPVQKEGAISFPVLTGTGAVEIIEILRGDPALDASDPRVSYYKGADYLPTLSHLRLLQSEDGVRFYESGGYPVLVGEGPLESFGVEDCRVTLLEDKYYLSYTAVAENGVGVGLRSPRGWK